jgi:hypothetical protein
MDINTLKLVRDDYSSKQTEKDKLQIKQTDNKNKKGCLKLADYMAF